MAEQSLLLASGAISLPAGPKSSGGDGTPLDTILNVVNIAFGAGMLGLPYAIQGAGFVTGIIGMGVVLLWNFVCCWRLVELRNEILYARAQASPGSGLARAQGTPVTFAMVGDFAMGQLGSKLVYLSHISQFRWIHPHNATAALGVLRASWDDNVGPAVRAAALRGVIVTLLGASTAYFITANELLRKTRFYIQFGGMSDTTTMYVNTLVYISLMFPVACIKSLAPLSRLSGPAILALVAGFGVIIKLGLDVYGFPSWDEICSWDALHVPTTFEGFSSFFGVAVFSYGATIIIVEIQESMAETEEFVGALKISLWIIWTSYSILGGLALLIYQQAGPVSDNIMEDLKGGEAAQEPLRIFIVCATLLTYPLAMQPVSTVFGRALIAMGYGVTPASKVEYYGAVANGTNGAPVTGTVVGTIQAPFDPFLDDSVKEPQLPPYLYYGLRAALVTFTGVCATSVPNFGVVISLLGSFAVTLGSFVLPPLFHMLVFKGKQTQMAEMADLAMFILGVVTCVFCTTTTALGVIYGHF